VALRWIWSGECGVGDKVGREGTNNIIGVFPPLSQFVVQIAL
jgi:hypothetical protein